MIVSLRKLEFFWMDEFLLISGYARTKRVIQVCIQKGGYGDGKVKTNQRCAKTLTPKAGGAVGSDDGCAGREADDRDASGLNPRDYVSSLGARA